MGGLFIGENMKIVDLIEAHLVEDARNVLKWWSTWVYAAIGVTGILSLLIEAAPQSFRDCITATAPKWVVVAMTSLSVLGIVVRLIKQNRSSDGPAA
jgi:hypothetical protein